MSSIFPGSASVGQIFEGYTFNGIAWDLIGNEFNPTTFSPTAPDNPKAGDLWVDSDSNVPSISNETILTIDSASATYATKAELENIDALPIQTGNAGKYLTTSGSAASWSTIDLTSAINTASAAAVTYLVDSAPGTLDTLNELAAALNDDANFSSTVTTSLGNKLDISSASTTYLSKNEASSTYLTSASMQTVPVYVMNSGSSAQRPVSPSAGMFRFNTDSGYPEWYSSENNAWFNFYQQAVFPIQVGYLVIAGGGGGGHNTGGGGGAGGYRNSVAGESSGANSTAEIALTLNSRTQYGVTVGAGGVAGTSGTSPTNGSNSSFSSIVSTGGGRGGSTTIASSTGGSGGGGFYLSSAAGSTGTSLQGLAGSAGVNATARGGAGGGAGGNGGVFVQAFTTTEANGGIGLSSSITGTATVRGGGGAGGVSSATYYGSVGGSGGGGNSGNPGTNATANTGGGAGGGNQTANGGIGGSGVVILSYSSDLTITIGEGLTGSTSMNGANKVTTFTAGTGTVSFV
jgi:hypothetical protein